MLKFSLSFLTLTETIMRLLYTVCLWFSNIIYGTAAAVYSLFYKIVQLSSPEFRNVFSSLNGLIDRLKLFIGLFIMFKIVIILINSIVDPEAKEGLGSASNYIWRIVLIVGMLIAYPFAFSYLDEAQSVLMGVGSDQGNVIARIFLGTESAESVTGADAGKRLMNEVYLSFFHVGDTNFVYSSSNCEGQYGSQGYLCEVYEGESISYLNEQGLFDDTNVKWEYPVLSGLVGVLFIVIFVQYCFDTAGRLFLLLLLQVLAPIPIICYIDPKEGTKILSSYIKHYATSYFELFFNVSLMFVSMALCKTVSNVSAYIFSLWQSADALSSISNCLVVIILYISLFMTIKKLPKIIDEIFGTNLGGSLKDKFSAGLKVVGGGAGLVAGTTSGVLSGMWRNLGSGAGNVVKGAFEGGIAGGYNGLKNGTKTQNLKSYFDNRKTAKTATIGTIDSLRENNDTLIRRGVYNLKDKSGIRQIQENRYNRKLNKGASTEKIEKAQAQAAPYLEEKAKYEKAKESAKAINDEIKKEFDKKHVALQTRIDKSQEYKDAVANGRYEEAAKIEKRLKMAYEKEFYDHYSEYSTNDSVKTKIKALRDDFESWRLLDSGTRDVLEKAIEENSQFGFDVLGKTTTFSYDAASDTFIKREVAGSGGIEKLSSKIDAWSDKAKPYMDTARKLTTENSQIIDRNKQRAQQFKDRHPVLRATATRPAGNPEKTQKK